MVCVFVHFTGSTLGLCESKTMEGLEEDPAAAFLAREQDELADIADDTLGGFESTAQTTVSSHLTKPPILIHCVASSRLHHKMQTSLEGVVQR